MASCRLVCGTLWEGIQPVTDLDFEDCEKSFAAAKLAVTRSGSKTKKEVAMVSLLPPKRENNCSILMTHLKHDGNAIVAAMLSMEPSLFGNSPETISETLTLLTHCSPTPEEKTMLDEHEVHPGDPELSPVDSFFLQLIHGVGGDLSLRIQGATVTCSCISFFDDTF